MSGTAASDGHHQPIPNGHVNGSFFETVCLLLVFSTEIPSGCLWGWQSASGLGSTNEGLEASTCSAGTFVCQVGDHASVGTDFPARLVL